MPLLHIVALRFRDDLTDEQIIAHFNTEVRLQNRMPDLVQSFFFYKNVTLEARRPNNLGCQWTVISRLFRAEDLPTYIDHPQHREVGAIQAPMLVDKFVVDLEVGTDVI